VGEAFASVLVGDHYEHHRLRSKLFKQWLAQQYYQHSNGAPSAQAVSDALSVLEAKSIFDGKERQVHVRLAELDDVIYLDLANENWEAVAISPTGWHAIANPPVAFR
jgi:putative DNA primase/helicase